MGTLYTYIYPGLGLCIGSALYNHHSGLTEYALFIDRLFIVIFLYSTAPYYTIAVLIQFEAGSMLEPNTLLIIYNYISIL